MFNRKVCNKCGEKINPKHNFCPECGKPLKENKSDYGLLGKNDSAEINEMQNIFSGFGGGMMNKMLNNAMKMLEKEMQKDFSELNNQPKTNFELFINGKRVSPDKIKVTKKPMQQKQVVAKKDLNIHLSPKSKQRFLKMKKQEPSTNIKRLSDKIIYEINLPEVKSIEDISIIQLENSIEIKAVSEKKAYEKIINLNLPIINYGLSDGKLILELKN